MGRGVYILRKLYILTIAILISIFALTGCGSSGSKKSTDSNSNTYKDGTYKGTYDKADSRGWKSQISIVIKDGKITKVDFNDVDKNGKLKIEDAAYGKSMKEKNGTEPKEFIPKLDEQLISSQNASKVNAITGATESSTKFKELSKAVLDKAKTGDISETVLKVKSN